jgi:hypothetical protein
LRQQQGQGLHLYTYLFTGENMTQDEMIEMAKQAGWQYAHGDSGYEPLWAFAKLVAQHEREACAKVCEQTNDGTPYNLAEACAEAIRARGQA